MSEERASGLVEGRVVRVEHLSPRVRGVWIATTEPLPFRAGQHVALRRDAAHGPDSFYSFSGVATAPRLFELAVGSGPSTLGELAQGDVVYASAALGEAMLDRFPGDTPLQLVAMGTGVAPLRAVIQEQLAAVDRGELPHRSLTLVHGCRDEEECLFREEFLGFVARELLDYRPVLSRPGSGWAGRVGRVQEHVDELVLPTARYLICGSLGMVEDVLARLSARGVHPTSVLAEGY